MLLATGMLDAVPDIPGLAEVWGTSAQTCPYCDGFATVNRVNAAGNCADPRVLAPAAAGSGATAAVAINARLSAEDADHAVTNPRARRTEVR